MFDNQGRHSGTTTIYSKTSHNQALCIGPTYVHNLQHDANCSCKLHAMKGGGGSTISNALCPFNVMFMFRTMRLQNLVHTFVR